MTTGPATPTAPAPLIAISIVNWNTPTLTLRCLHALEALRYPNYRIVVVDNASADDSVEAIRRRYPDLAIVRNPDNLGFAGGHRRGLEQAQAWGAAGMWLVDSDAEADPSALDLLVAAWRQHGDALYGGAPLVRDDATATLLNFPSKFLADAAGPALFRRDRRIVFDRSWEARTPFRVAAVVGSCLFVPLALVEAHGWMDAAWFMYCEEIDWCLRLRERGVASWLVPQAQVVHRSGGSHRWSAAVTDCIGYYHARNETALFLRHAGRASGLIVAARKTGRAALAALSNPRRGRLILRGVRDALGGRMGKTLAPEDFAGPNPAPARRAHLFAISLHSRIALRVERLLGNLRLRLRQSPCRIECIGGVSLAWNPHHLVFIREYYRYCVALFSRELARCDRPLNVVFGDYAVDFGNAHRTLRVDIQWEHTLVKPGGRDSGGAIAGRIPVPGSGQTYLVRIARLDYLRGIDLIIDYSRPNLGNIAACGRYDDYLAKTICLAPLLGDIDLAPRRRERDLLTLFGDLGQPRRKAFLEAARASGLGVTNVRGLFAQADLSRLYRGTRMLVNVHQTDHHHTFEELRILPALMCGVVIVSEDVPLRDEIPYARFVIWSSYDNLVATTQATLADYARHYDRIFNDPELVAVLSAMGAANLASVERVVRHWSAEKAAAVNS